MKGYTYTRVWEIDGTLVVAKTPEEAIGLMRERNKNDNFYQPRSVICVRADGGNGIFDYDALIADEER